MLGRKRDSRFRKETAFHDAEQEEQRQLLPGLHVPWDEVSPFPPLQSRACAARPYLPSVNFGSSPRPFSPQTGASAGKGRKAEAGRGRVTGAAPAGPERRQEARARRPRARVPGPSRRGAQSGKGWGRPGPWSVGSGHCSSRTTLPPAPPPCVPQPPLLRCGPTAWGWKARAGGSGGGGGSPGQCSWAWVPAGPRG